MELSTFSSNQFAIFLPVGVVILFAVLIFAFGFKSPVEPPSFKYTSVFTDEKKNLRKKKVKDKKQQTNGHATVVIEVADAKKSDGASKVGKQASKAETPKPKKSADTEKLEKKTEPLKSPTKKEKKPSEGKKRDYIEKPADFDEGEWETAPSRKDKKKKKDEDIIAAITPEKVSKKKVFPANKDKIEENLKVEEKVEEVRLNAGGDASPSVEIEKESVPVAADPIAPVTVTPPELASPQPVASSKQVEPDSSEELAAKKKKGKKGKSGLPEEDSVVPEVEPPVAPSSPAAAESPQAFNELEDSWKDAPQRKSKKKVRKD